MESVNAMDRPPSRARWVITTRLRDDQHQQLLDAAVAAGKSLNQYVLDTLLPPPTCYTAPFHEWFAELALHAAAFPSQSGWQAKSLGDKSAAEWRRMYELGCTPQQAWGYPLMRTRRRRGAQSHACSSTSSSLIGGE